MTEALPLLVAIPLGAAFLLPIIHKAKAGEWAINVIAALVAAFTVAMAFSLLAAPLGDGSALTLPIGGWTGNADPEAGPVRALGITMACDGFTRLMLITVNSIALVATLFSFRYIARFTAPGLYFSLFFVMLAGMNGVVLAGDLFNLYVFLEVAAVASYALVAFGTERDELEASFKYLVLGTIASTFVLFGVGICYNLTGTLNMARVAEGLAAAGANTAVLLATGFFLMGFGLKAAMVPFHAWLPDAHPSAPAPISAMLSGVLIKALGIYAICRVVFNVLGVTAPVAGVLITLGALSMTIGVLLAVGQWDFKRLLAYHSISQMGYVMLAVGIAAEVAGRAPAVALLALFGGLFHLINHAAFKSLLFLCSGATEYGTGTRLLKKLGGLGERMPVTSGCCRVAALSISGVPPFNGFWSKLIIIVAAVQAGHPWLAALTVFVSFMTLLSFIKVQRYILGGEPSEAVGRAREVPVSMCAAMVVLALVCLGAGLLVPLFRESVIDPACTALLNGAKSIAQARGLMP
jgi:multicomponent Na+:H+ antiporter subunit D